MNKFLEYHQSPNAKYRSNGATEPDETQRFIGLSIPEMLENSSDLAGKATGELAVLRPSAISIYSQIFPGCQYKQLSSDTEKAHWLDKYFGIDAIITLRDGSIFTIQEKYRSNEHLVKYGDFTQHYKKACGLPQEGPGEWFHLGAQLFFYGWGNPSRTAFSKWILLDVTKYKLIVHQNGGLQNVGELNHNSEYGSGSFYAIKLSTIQESILYSSETINAFIQNSIPDYLWRNVA